jgi:hypothetical protein
VPPVCSDAELGETAIVTGGGVAVTVTCTETDLVESARLVAVTV